MRLPYKFLQVHQSAAFKIWQEVGRPPFIKVVLQEPLQVPSAKAPLDSVSLTVSYVCLACYNRSGVFYIEAANPDNLKIIQEWVERHKNTPYEEFRWFPDFTEPSYKETKNVD